MKQINIKGAIVSDDDKWLYDFYDLTATAPQDIDLPKTGEPVEVIINSGGGDVFAGSEIYSLLSDYQGDVTVKIVGIAASAASVIAMAGKSVEISPTAQIMIHNVSSVAGGDYRALAKEAQILENYNKSISNAYLMKTNMSSEELLDLMAEETWLTAGQAVEKGFADKVMFADDEMSQMVASESVVIPKSMALVQKAEIKERAEILERLERLENHLINQKSKKEETKETPKLNGFSAFLFNSKSKGDNLNDDETI